MTSAATTAQGKLNLRLQVLAREESGFHSIETIFHRIELGDATRVTLQPRERTIASDVDVGPAESNLAYRAAVRFCEIRDWDTGFHIELVKRIPAGGGLGGGSADAAAVLRMMNELAPRHVRQRDVLTAAASLGADVPFLASDAVMALAWSRGERMIALPALPQRWVALALPGFAVSTSAAYAAVRAREMMPSPYASPRVASLDDLSVWTNEIGLGPRNWFAGNDLAPLPLTADERRIVQTACDALADAGADFGGVTGSGSTIYGIFTAQPDAAALAERCGCRVLVTRTATRVCPVEIG